MLVSTTLVGSSRHISFKLNSLEGTGNLGNQVINSATKGTLALKDDVLESLNFTSGVALGVSNRGNGPTLSDNSGYSRNSTHGNTMTRSGHFTSNAIGILDILESIGSVSLVISVSNLPSGEKLSGGLVKSSVVDGMQRLGLSTKVPTNKRCLSGSRVITTVILDSPWVPVGQRSSVDDLEGNSPGPLLDLDLAVVTKGGSSNLGLGGTSSPHVLVIEGSLHGSTTHGISLGGLKHTRVITHIQVLSTQSLGSHVINHIIQGLLAMIILSGDLGHQSINELRLQLESIIPGVLILGVEFEAGTSAGKQLGLGQRSSLGKHLREFGDHLEAVEGNITTQRLSGNSVLVFGNHGHSRHHTSLKLDGVGSSVGNARVIVVYSLHVELL
mmetsp:Transcript_136112/g.192470  ORF Transcript_136112/g.192470 Transcript_136112/m.192470 type:complete len:385 (-) Transcript_136112:894-2048(-)